VLPAVLAIARLEVELDLALGLGSKQLAHWP
jgi:hypothetical protein